MILTAPPFDEIEAMEAIVRALEPLSHEGRRRALKWALERFIYDAKTPEGD